MRKGGTNGGNGKVHIAEAYRLPGRENDYGGPIVMSDADVSAQNRVVPVSLRFKLTNLEEVASKSELCDTPTFHLLFSGYPRLQTDGIDVFETLLGEKRPVEVVSWLYWLWQEKGNYCDPKQYRKDAPLQFLELERNGRKSNGNEDLQIWADGHVLMHYLEEAPYLTLQSPSQTELEVFWAFADSAYVNRNGKVTIDQQRFLEELEKVRRSVGRKIFRKIPQLKKAQKFEFLL